MTPRIVVRFALGYLALVSLQLGLWALLAPGSFFDDFPGLGRSWIAVDGPFNEHLVRDVGGLNLALFVLLIAAAIRATRDLVMVAGLASLAWGVPHLAYHVIKSEPLREVGMVDFIASTGGLAVFVFAAAMLVVTGRRLPETTSSNSGAAQVR